MSVHPNKLTSKAQGQQLRLARDTLRSSAVNHEIFPVYRQAEGVKTVTQYDQLDAIACVKTDWIVYNGKRGYCLDFYVSSPGNDEIWPAIITIYAKSLIDARHVIRDVRNKIRLDVAPSLKDENI